MSPAAPRPHDRRVRAAAAAVRAALAGLLVLAAGCRGGDGRTPVVIYSPHGRDLLSHFEQAYEASHPDVDVQWVDMGSQEVLDRVRSEKANPQADVWWGAPSEIFSRAADEGLLAPDHPSWEGAVPASARDSAGRWIGTYRTPEVIAYNSDTL
ncbi:MAG TPA: extracellular solute-binding protein, partial [Gemmatimonadota bacterium]|nr:extracellular solute-binding protein [Gemmatimonadota bacterium]